MDANSERLIIEHDAKLKAECKSAVAIVTALNITDKMKAKVIAEINTYYVSNLKRDLWR